KRVVAAYDRLVNLGTSGNVVRLHGQHFLQRIGRAVSFERPDLHLTEALATELRLTTQRLLSNEGVRSDRTRMDLVIDQVMQLQHVDVADSHITVECLTRTAIVQGNLAA